MAAKVISQAGRLHNAKNGRYPVGAIADFAERFDGCRLTAAGLSGDETIYHLAARHAQTVLQACVVHDRHRGLSDAELNRRRRAVGGASRRSWQADPASNAQPAIVAPGVSLVFPAASHER